MWLSRRAMLRCSVVLLGVTRTLWASTALPAISYRDLTRPVTVPLGDVSERWQFVEFDAWAVDASGGDLLLKGVLVRTQLADDPADGLVAFCLACPHEICYVVWSRIPVQSSLTCKGQITRCLSVRATSVRSTHARRESALAVRRRAGFFAFASSWRE